MKDLLVDQAEALVVAPPVERHTWASDQTEMFMTGVYLRLTTKGGLVGFGCVKNFTPYDFDRSVAETLRPFLPQVLGLNPLERESIWERFVNRLIMAAPQAQSAIDIALWDLAAKHAGLPLHQMLGGARSKIRAYASTPLLKDTKAYVDFVGKLMAQGFTATKLHCWCEVDRDIPMVQAVRKRYGADKLDVMLDVEQRYSRADAMRALAPLAEAKATWFEAPLLDVDVHGYRALTARGLVDIVPGGNSIVDLGLIELAIANRVWSRVRIDSTTCGGITPARKIMALAEAHGMQVELQSWGFTPVQAANLHLMLAYPNCTYFEQAVPYAAFEYGSTDPIRPDAQGFVHAPPGPGLGVGVDWAAIEKSTILRLTQTRKGLTVRQA
ncbi:MAG: mandelate racemase/muconate lactonizing enzyme family protein [Alphaproteobacteria bacterium]